MDLQEARMELDLILSDDIKKNYFALLRQLVLFNCPITKEQFDQQARKLLIRDEEIRAHNKFIKALIYKISPYTCKPPKPLAATKGTFENADFLDYAPTSPNMLPPPDLEIKSAASELFLPDNCPNTYVSTRIAITAWEHGFDSVDEELAPLMVHACQTLVRNILTAMISRKKGFKMRDNKLMYGFNQPIPDPFLKNYRNVQEYSEESVVDFSPSDDSFVPIMKRPYEFAEQKLAFEYSGSKMRKVDNTLTVKLLYDTLNNNPGLLGHSASHKVNLLKLSLRTDL